MQKYLYVWLKFCLSILNRYAFLMKNDFYIRGRKW